VTTFGKKVINTINNNIVTTNGATPTKISLTEPSQSQKQLLFFVLISEVEK
jgi:hypothetical protein